MINQKILSQTIPKTKVRIVIGIPAFKYSKNSSLIPCRFADSATIKFATEPSSVRFPAKVDDIASASQRLSALFNFKSAGLINKTAGTLETRLLKTAEITERSKIIFPLIKPWFNLKYF
mgnify:CR=1 FL=1